MLRKKWMSKYRDTIRLLRDIEQCEATLEELDVKKQNAYQRKGEEAQGDTAELVGAGKIAFKAC